MTDQTDLSLSSNEVLVTAGEFFLDLIFYDLAGLPDFGEELKTDNFEFTFGGGAPITAAAAARLGRTSQLVTAWGDSALDEAAKNRLNDLGVGCDWSRVVPGALSGLTVAVSTRKDRFFLTAPGANKYVEPTLVSEDFVTRIRTASHLHLALTPTAWAPFEELVERVQKAGITVSWDMGWDTAAAEDEGFRRLCKNLDVLFLNDKEAQQYSGLEDLTEAARWFAGSQKAIVIKCGRRGSVALTDSGDWIEAPPVVVDAVDSTGAGDAFNGGFLHAWMAGQDPRVCLQSGNVCGALSTRRAGGIEGLPDSETHSQTLQEQLHKDHS